MYCIYSGVAHKNEFLLKIMEKCNQMNVGMCFEEVRVCFSLLAVHGPESFAASAATSTGPSLLVCRWGRPEKWKGKFAWINLWKMKILFSAWLFELMMADGQVWLVYWIPNRLISVLFIHLVVHYGQTMRQTKAKANQRIQHRLAALLPPNARFNHLLIVLLRKQKASSQKQCHSFPTFVPSSCPPTSFTKSSSSMLTVAVGLRPPRGSPSYTWPWPLANSTA